MITCAHSVLVRTQEPFLRKKVEHSELSGIRAGVHGITSDPNQR